MGGGGGKVGVAVDAVVHHQVAGQHLAVDALAAGAGAGNGVGGFDAAHVHHVDRHVQHIGNGDGAVGGFAFHPGGRDSGWPSGPVMPISAISFCSR